MMSSRRIFYGSPNPEMDFVNEKAETLALYEIANSVFMLEKRVKEGKTFPKNIILHVPKEIYNASFDEILVRLSDLVADILLEDVTFEWKIIDFKDPEKETEFPKRENIILFSGGVDSVVGLYQCVKNFRNLRALYVAHQDTSRINHIVGKMKDSLVKPLGVDFSRMLAPAMGRKYSQTRGLVYMLYGGIIAFRTGARQLLVCECGATMYQPKFAPFDTITFTTNPRVLQTCKKIVEIILDREFNIITPFENLTKTELMSLLPDDSILSQTHSCITSQWGSNCGKCYACITRMIGSVNLNLSISYFRKNIFTEADKENLDALIEFCLFYLYNRKRLDYWSYRNIRFFGKEELFERVALDTFLTLTTLKKEGNLHPNYLFALDYVEERSGLLLSQREKEIKKMNVKPDFSKVVKIE